MSPTHIEMLLVCRRAQVNMIGSPGLANKLSQPVVWQHFSIADLHHRRGILWVPPFPSDVDVTADVVLLCFPFSCCV